MTMLRSMPVLQVSDVPRSVDFYGRAGFASHGIWEHDGEAQFSIVQRGEVSLGLQLEKGDLPVNSHWAAYVYVSDVTVLHEELSAEDLRPTAIRRGNPYGCDDFDLKDPDGHVIAFGQDVNPQHGPGLSADKGRG